MSTSTSIDYLPSIHDAVVLATTIEHVNDLDPLTYDGHALPRCSLVYNNQVLMFAAFSLHVACCPAHSDQLQLPFTQTYESNQTDASHPKSMLFKLMIRRRFNMSEPLHPQIGILNLSSTKLSIQSTHYITDAICNCCPDHADALSLVYDYDFTYGNLTSENDDSVSHPAQHEQQVEHSDSPHVSTEPLTSTDLLRPKSSSPSTDKSSGIKLSSSPLSPISPESSDAAPAPSTLAPSLVVTTAPTAFIRTLQTPLNPPAQQQLQPPVEQTMTQTYASAAAQPPLSELDILRENLLAPAPTPRSFSDVIYQPTHPATIATMLANPPRDTYPTPTISTQPESILPLTQRPSTSTNITSLLPPRPTRPNRPIWFVHKVLSLQQLLCLDALRSTNQSIHIWNILKSLIKVPDDQINSYRRIIANYSVFPGALIEHILEFHQHATISDASTYSTNVTKDIKECGISRCFMYHRASPQTDVNVFLPSFDALSCYYLIEDSFAKIRSSGYRRPPATVITPADGSPVYHLDDSDFEVTFGVYPPASQSPVPPRPDRSTRRPRSLTQIPEYGQSSTSSSSAISQPTFRRFPRLQ
jgi:hypothetical protein